MSNAKSVSREDCRVFCSMISMLEWRGMAVSRDPRHPDSIVPFAIVGEVCKDCTHTAGDFLVGSRPEWSAVLTYEPKAFNATFKIDDHDPSPPSGSMAEVDK